MYTQFVAVRPSLRSVVVETMLSAAKRLSMMPALAAGARLHAMDGGARLSGVSAAGLIALLELCLAVARGYRQPLAPQHHELLWEVVLALHAPDNAVDDTTPMLQLYHRPLVLWTTALLRKAPELVPRYVGTLVTTQWPGASDSNSTKEVLLLHELEQILEHAPAAIMDDAAMREQLLHRMVSSIDGGKNFRVAERALMMWRSDGVRNLLSGSLAEVLALFLPALLEASKEHWNHSVLKMIGVVLGLLAEMVAGAGGDSGAEMLAEACQKCGTTAEAVREKALELNPPVDHAAVAAAAAATETAIQERQRDQSFNVYSVALGHELAVGAFSRVRYAKLILKGLEQKLWPDVAVKIQERAVVEAQSYEENVRREIAILERMEHPAVIRLVGWFETETAIWMLLELAQGGDLHGVLTAHGSLSVPSVQFLGAEVLLGLAALHANGVVYGDLKPENILLDAGHVKLADFGSARLIEDDSEQPAQTAEGEGVRVEGTAEYVAPEVASGRQLASFASDAWAYGCVLFQLLAGRPPILLLHEDPAVSELVAQQNALDKVVQFAGVDETFFPEEFAESTREVVSQLLLLDEAARLGEAGWDGNATAKVLEKGPLSALATHAVACLSGVRALEFFGGIDFESIFESDAPALGGGIVSAAAAKERNWNRRKQSMMWAPMPEQYSATDGAALAPVPEESQAEAAAAAKALAGVSLARGLAAATHHQLDDGTMRPIAEGPGDAA